MIGLLIAAYSSALWGCASGPVRPSGAIPIGDTSYLKQALDYEVAEFMADRDLASITLTVVDANGPMYERAFGKADIENGVAATLDTPYRWGSNSKLFVMLSLLQLAEQGKLSLDAPLTRYVPEFEIGPPPSHLPESKSWSIEDITIRRMLTHHSGLPNDILAGFLSERPGSYRDHVRRMKEMNAQAPAGLVHSYSNAAFSLLGVVIERVSGETYDTYVKNRIFRPVGMDGASFSWNDRLTKTVARSYDAAGDPMPLYRVTDVPAGALLASAREMGLFASAVLRGGVGARGRFIENASLLASYQRQNAHVALDFDLECGLGWMVNPLPVAVFGKNVGHGGMVPGSHTSFALLTDIGVAALVATNSESGSGKLNVILKRALALAREVKTGQRTAELHIQPMQRADVVDEDELRKSIGHYTTLLGSVALTRDDDQLTFLLGEQRMFLKPLVDGGWGVWAELWGLVDLQPGSMSKMRITIEEIDGRKVAVGYKPGGRLLLGVAYQPSQATPPWKKRLGTYRVVTRPGDYNEIVDIRIYTADNGQLMAEPTLRSSKMPLSVALRVIDPGTAISEGLGRNQGMRVTADAQGDLHLAGLRFRRVVGSPR